LLEGNEYYDLVDEFSEEMMNKIYLKKEVGGFETVIDLPSRDLISPNIDALKNYVQGNLSLNRDVNDPDAAAVFFNKSVELDDKCAECFTDLAACSSIKMDIASSSKYITTANHLATSLPERQKLRIQQKYYSIKQQPDKALKLLERWMKLYPSDYLPYSSLMEYYSMVLEFDKAKVIGEKALSTGHKGTVLTRMARLYMATEDLDKAEELLNEFADRYPHKAQHSSVYSDLAIKKGEWAKAKDLLEKINITDPGDIGTLLDLGTLEENTGDYDKALEYYNNALAECTRPQDSVDVIGEFEKYYTRFGQINKVIDYQNQRLALMKKYIPVVNVDIAELQTGYRYTWVDRKEELREFNDQLKSKYSQNPILPCVADWLYFLFIEDKEEFKKTNAKCEHFMVASSGKNFKYYSQGMLDRFDENWEGSLKSLETYVDSTGVGYEMLGSALAEAYRKAGKLKKSKEYIQRVLKTAPNEPTFLLSLAQTEIEMNNKSEAKTLINKCLDLWKNADPDYIHLIQAKELLATLE